MPMPETMSPYYGSGKLTREQFLFFEMRTTAKLMNEGLSDEDIIQRIVSENLFQYPTEKSLREISLCCLHRLHGLENQKLVQAIALGDATTARQTCLYAMMREYRLVADFMITVIGNKYRQQDFTFNRRDINAFLNQLQEQDDLVATWAESTVKKIGTVLCNLLIVNDYIEKPKATELNAVAISNILYDEIKNDRQEEMLPAFNCFR